MSIVRLAHFGKLLGVAFSLLAGLPGSTLHGQEGDTKGIPGVPNWGLTDRVKDMGKPEPSHGELVLHGLEQIREFGLDRQTEARQKALAGYIPEGKDVKVVFLYSVRKVVRGEAPEITLLDDVYPEKIQVLQEPASVRNLEFKQEEVVIHGTGRQLKQGAPAFPAMASSNDQLRWIEWNQWRERSTTWEKQHQHEVSMRAMPETVMREDPSAALQMDPSWVARNQKLLGLTTDQLRTRPDAQLAGMADVLRTLVARTGPSWSPTPGGVLLSPDAAGKLGDGLTIDKVEYLPGSGEVKVSGDASVMGLDADLLAATLRLAFGYDQVPYFSLEPHGSYGGDQDGAHDRVLRELEARLRTDSAFAAAFQREGFEVVDNKGRRVRLACLDRLDPALSAQVARQLPMDMDLVFQPKWLRRTRLGEMLFIADQSIKELWRGVAVWSHGPSRALKVGTHIAPQFWSERNLAKEQLEEMIHRSIETSHMTRWWFTPGGRMGEAGNVLDLSQVQPVLQTERIGGTGKASWDMELGMGLKIHQEIVYDPLAPLVNQEDPWSKAVVAEVNRHFNAYAAEFPEWEGLRQVFRAYVLAIWLRKHDPAMGRRLMAQLPPPRPPDRPLPSVWPDPQILVMQVAGGQDGVELGQMTICGGVGFERSLLTQTPGAAGGGMGSLSSFPSGEGFSPNPIDDSPATPEGYAKWRIALQRERGYLWGWAGACLAPGELLTFFGLALALAVFAFWQERRKEHATFNGIQAGAIAVDTAATTLVFILTALHPDLYKNHTAPFTAWWGAVLIYTIGFIKGGRLGRLGMFGVVMFIVLVWTVFTPGIGEMWRGFLPLHLALPALGPGWGEPLPTDVIYTLQALRDGLQLGRSAEPRYALYLILIFLVALGFWLETRLESKQPAPSTGS